MARLGATVARLLDRFPRRVVSDAEPAFYCTVCRSLFDRDSERIVIHRFPQSSYETWCLRCWAVLLVSAREHLVALESL